MSDARELARAAMLSLACQGAVMSKADAAKLARMAAPDDHFLEQLETARTARRRLDEANREATRMLMAELGWY